MIVWHHRLNAHEFEQAPGIGDGQESLVFCSPWGRKELDTTERLNNTIGDLGFPKWLSSKESACQAGDVGLTCMRDSKRDTDV